MSWKTTLTGVLMIIGAVFALKKTFMGAWAAGDVMPIVPAVSGLLGGLGLIFARDHNVTSEQAGLKDWPPLGAAADDPPKGGTTYGAGNAAALPKSGTTNGGGFAVLILAGLCLVGACGCSGMAGVVKAMAKDPAIASVRIRQPTPWGTLEADVSRVGVTTNTVSAGSGTVLVNTAPKKAAAE